MKSRWKTYLLYASLIVLGGALVFILIETVKAKNTGFETKTLWDWMELLVIPLVLSMGALFLNRSERVVERETTNKRAELERGIAKDRQQEAALQSYLDRMAELLLKEKLRTTEIEEVRDVARTRTLSVMRGLDVMRSNLIIQFLREAKLITDGKSILNGADMQGMNLQGLDLKGVYLQRANLHEANLGGSLLYKANLQEADLSLANLQMAFLVEANLQGAYLTDTNLTGALLGDANLKGAILNSSKLKGAILNNASLKGAQINNTDFENANLGHAHVTKEQLATAESLKGATMPDGTIHD